jgi:hypothetical protein
MLPVVTRDEANSAPDGPRRRLETPEGPVPKDRPLQHCSACRYFSMKFALTVDPSCVVIVTT